MKPNSDNLLIQITGLDTGKQCDLYPHNSVHIMQKDDKGILWNIDRTFSTPDPNIEYKFIESAEIKQCVLCKNAFVIDAVFMKKSCMRCFEKRHIPNREEYNTAKRAEVLNTLIDELLTELKSLRKIRKDEFRNDLHYYNPIEVAEYLQSKLKR